jgi:predicted helicase
MGKMTESAFNEVIQQDIRWLENIISEKDKNNSLEFSHIVNTLRYAAKQYGSNGKRIDELSSHICITSQDFNGNCMFCKKPIL